MCVRLIALQIVCQIERDTFHKHRQNQFLEKHQQQPPPAEKKLPSEYISYSFFCGLRLHRLRLPQLYTSELLISKQSNFRFKLIF